MNSLELNWIRNIDKSIPVPKVIYYPMSDASGKYFLPTINAELYDFYGTPHSVKNGIICINIDLPSANIEGTIAHEWRHHWQCFNGMKFTKSPIDLFDKLDYYSALRRYFLESALELDALRFEYKYSTIPIEWEETLYDLLVGIKSTPTRITFTKYG